jgi:hypothetical protein
MKYFLAAIFVFISALCVNAQTGGSSQNGNSRANVEACLSRCASAATSCQAVCPKTFSGPCLSSCDTQAQYCRQACLGR